MDTNNWGTTTLSGEPTMDTVDWRTQLPPDSRRKIVDRVMYKLKQHCPHREALDRLEKVAKWFEEKTFIAASSKDDYLTKIKSKMLEIDMKSLNTVPNTANNSKPLDPAFQAMQNQVQVQSQGQAIPSPAQSNQSQARQQLLPQNVPNNMASAGVQTCAGLQSGMPPVSGLTQNPISNVVGQNSNMQNRSRISQNSLGQGMLSHGYANQQMQKQGKEQVLPQPQQLLINFTNTSRPRKLASTLQQGQLPPPHIHSMQQPQPQINQTQSHENQMNQLQSMNLQGSVQTVQNDMTSLQHNSLSSLPLVSIEQQTMLNSMGPSSNLDSGQGNALGSMQQVAPGPLLQNPVSTPQLANNSSSSLQSGLSALQQNMNPLPSNSNMLPQQHLKEQPEQQMLQSQQYHKRQMQLQLQQQQLDQQAKQQLPTQLQMQTHQMSQLHQINDVNDIITRQGLVINQGVFEQHLPPGDRTYTHQQLEAASQSPFSSPHLLQATSPQIPQNSSQQLDWQSQPTSISKTGTALHSANSPFVIPSPSTPLAPSHTPGESEKSVPGTSSMSNAASVEHYQGTDIQAVSQPFVICTPGISASPLLAEFIDTDANHASALATDSSNLNITEQPVDRLMKAVESMSPLALVAAVSDIGWVVSITDRIAGSVPGNGAKATVGEDLVAMTKCHLRARNFINQHGTSGTKKMRGDISTMPLN